MVVIKEILGRSVEFGGEHHSGWLPEGAAVPLPNPIRLALLDLKILGDKSGFILEWKSRNTTDSGDTWHPTLEEALEAARLGFGVEVSEWQPSHGAS